MLVSKWVKENKLKLNVSKTKSILLGSNYALRPNHTLSLCMQGADIDQVKEAKLLGLTMRHYHGLLTLII